MAGKKKESSRKYNSNWGGARAGAGAKRKYPKKGRTIAQFRLDEEVEKNLKMLTVGDESIHQTARRVLREAVLEITK